MTVDGAISDRWDQPLSGFPFSFKLLQVVTIIVVVVATNPQCDSDCFIVKFHTNLELVDIKEHTLTHNIMICYNKHKC